MNMRERFEAKVSPEPNTGCWLWTSAVRKVGYGMFWMNGAFHGAHRVSYELYVGPIPAGLFVCHRCDVRSCVNPVHLFLGTQAENMADMAAKGRSSRGVRNSKARLDEDGVRRIRMLSPHVPQREIGRRLGVNQSTIRDVLLGRTWRHVDGAELERNRKRGES